MTQLIERRNQDAKDLHPDTMSEGFFMLVITPTMGPK